MKFHDKIGLHDKHVERLAMLHETFEGKKALLQMWEEKMDEKSYDHDYVMELRRKVRSLNVRIMAMRPPPMEQGERF